MGWQDRVDVVVEWGRRGNDSDVDAVWDVTDWDQVDRFWAGAEPQWLVLDDCELRFLDSVRGRAVGVGPIPAATASVELLFTESVAGVPVPGDRWSWRSPISIGDELRVRAVDRDSGVTYPVFRGDIRSMADGWDPRDRFVLSLNLTGIKGRLGRVDLDAVDPPVGVGEGSGARIARIADLADVPPTRLDLDVGVTTVQGTTLARNMAGEADVTVASEGGDLFGAADGRLTFRDRYWLTADPRSVAVRMVWANVDVLPDPGVPVACPVTIGTRLALDYLENLVSLARAGGTAQVVEDTASRSRYGLQTYRRHDLINEDDADVLILAAWRLANNSHRLEIIDSIEINPLGDPDGWVAGVLDVEVGDRHRLVWDDGDSLTDVELHVQGVGHRVTPTAWSTSLRVWERRDPPGWDFQVWDYSDWDAAA